MNSYFTHVELMQKRLWNLQLMIQKKYKLPVKILVHWIRTSLVIFSEAGEEEYKNENH